MIKGRLQKTFLDLISIPEVYPNEERIIKYINSRLKKVKANFFEDSFRNVIVKIPGKGAPIMLCTHLDIPEPIEQLGYLVEGDLIKSDGSGILGADPKTGLAVLIEFIEDILAQKQDSHLPVELVFTRGEETGLFGARNLDYSRLEAKVGLVLDQDGPVTEVVIQAPAFVGFDSIFKGKTAHPRDPQEGINSLTAAAEAIMTIPPGYSTRGVTWNIGFLNSGTARNSIPGLTELKAELRSFNTKLVISEAKRIERTYQEICDKHHVSLELDWELEFEGYKLESNHPLFKRLEKTYSELNLVPNYFPTFGGSDANIFNAHGIVSVPIGSGYYNAHQYTEYANLKDMEEILKFLTVFVSM